jgi:hypothetical protein
MYWPIGAPRVYATNRLDLGKLAEDVNDEVQPDLVTLSSPTQASEADGQDETEKPTTQSSSKSRTSKRSAYLKDTVLDYSQDDRVGGEIVAVKLSRSGHLFVSITAATLSVWQTKVSIHTLSKISKSNMSAYFSSCNCC